MVTFASLLSFALFATALALPSPIADRRGGPNTECSSPNDSGFSITAVNITLPNTNTTGVPLVFYLTGEVEGGTYRSSYLATWATSYWNEYPEPVQLVNGSIFTHYDGQVANDGGDIAAGEPLLFIESSPPTTPTQAWCEEIDTSSGGSNSFPVLSVYGDAESFALCSQLLAGTWRNIVVYKPEEGEAYNLSTCYGVHLQAVPTPAPI